MGNDLFVTAKFIIKTQLLKMYAKYAPKSNQFSCSIGPWGPLAKWPHELYEPLEHLKFVRTKNIHFCKYTLKTIWISVPCLWAIGSITSGKKGKI